MEALPQYFKLHLPAMSTVQVLQKIEDVRWTKRRAETAATQQDPAGTEVATTQRMELEAGEYSGAEVLEQEDDGDSAASKFKRRGHQMAEQTGANQRNP